MIKYVKGEEKIEGHFLNGSSSNLFCDWFRLRCISDWSGARNGFV